MHGMQDALGMVSGNRPSGWIVSPDSGPERCGRQPARLLIGVGIQADAEH